MKGSLYLNQVALKNPARISCKIRRKIFLRIAPSPFLGVLLRILSRASQDLPRDAGEQKFYE